MNYGLEDKIAVVTGGSQGLGFATAHALLAEGARVVIGSRNESNLDQAKSRLLDEVPNGRVHTASVDVSSAASIAEFGDVVRAEVGDPDILVSNAGGPKSGGYDDVTSDDFLPALELSFLAAVRLFEQFLPAMRRKHHGRIVHIGSVSARQPIESLVLSNASRAAILGFAKSVAHQVAKDGVTINVVLPGFTRTDSLGELAESAAERTGQSPERVLSAWESQIPAGRLGEPKELADTIAFLCSDNASYITGTSIPVDGGYLKGLP